MSHTFKVDNVTENNSSIISNKPSRLATGTAKKLFEDKFRTTIDSCSDDKKLIVAPNSSGLINVAYLSFGDHRPMVIDPDSVWLTLFTQLSKHIELNAEALRSKFVTFKGKVFIEISRDDFVMDGNNPWDNCFPEFSDKIAEYIGDKRDIIVSNFSTTTATTKIISEIALMDAMKQYFDYGMKTRCGIPRITIEGSPEDWKAIRDKANLFSELGLEWWTEKLFPVLDEFYQASLGKPNLNFWKSFYNQGGGSGGPYIGGHITSLYAYLDGDRKNTFESGMFRGSTPENFPSIIASAPFVWNYYGNMFPMSFFGGIIGVEQDEDGAIRSSYAWGVRKDSIPFMNYAVENMSKDMCLVNRVTGENGLLKRVEVNTYGDSREISLVIIEWEKSGVVEYNFEKRYEKNNNCSELELNVIVPKKM